MKCCEAKSALEDFSAVCGVWLSQQIEELFDNDKEYVVVSAVEEVYCFKLGRALAPHIQVD